MARKYRSSKKYSYNQSAKTKKLVLIVSAAVLAVALIAAVLFLIFSGNGSDIVTNPHFFVLSRPHKTTYVVGEAENWFGLEVKLVTESGSTVLGPESCVISGFDSSAPAENQVITVQYMDLATTFTVSIRSGSDDPSGEQGGEQGGAQGNNQKPPNALFTGMSFKSLPKTQYKVGDFWLNVQGGVLLLRYDTGATREINMSLDMVEGFTTAAPGTYTLTVTYIEDGHRATLTYDITVTE